MPVAFDSARIPGLAPDKSSLDAGRKLASGSHWVVSACSDDGQYAWGECMGSGSSPYRVCIDASDSGSKCTCPSRKFPCKHAIGLMFRIAGKPDDFAAAPVPDWVAAWISRRRLGSAAPAPVPAADPQRQTSAPADLGPAPDPEAAAKAEAARERNRAAREASILEGLDGLDQWILDRLDRGLASFEATAEADCALIARRLTDAKAGTLAQRVIEMRGRFFSLPRQHRNDFILRELGVLHLLAAAYRRQDGLDAGLRDDVRREVGWTMQKAELMADAAALRMKGLWIVAGTTDTTQADGLRRIETWFALADPCAADSACFALLQDFVPASSGAQGSPFLPGEAMEAEFAFYPSAAPVRAVMTSRSGAAQDGTVHGLRHAPPLGEALDRMERVMARQPFIERWPLALGGVTVLDHGEDGFWIASGGHALPLADGAEAELIPLIGMDIDLIGIWDGWRLLPLRAETPLGPWHKGRS